ncbi:MAG: hypothetical protein RXO36_07680, partial [Candidatus Nanopusillus acidilobi]
MPGIDEVIVKGAGPEGGGNDDNNKKFNIKNLKEQLLKDKRTRYAVLGVVGFVIGMPLLFKILGGGTTVQVQQGLTKQQVKQTVEQTLQPVINQLQNNKQNQVAQNTPTVGSQSTNNATQGTQNTQSTNNTNNKQNTQLNKQTNNSGAEKTTQNQSPPLASILGLNQHQQTQQSSHPPTTPPTTGYPSTGYTPPLSTPMSMGSPYTEMKPPSPPEPKMVFMEMPMPKQQNNGYGYGTSGTAEKKSQNKKSVYIPAGSIAAGELMYGFTAPESGVLPPVVIKITKPIWTANN